MSAPVTPLRLLPVLLRAAHPEPTVAVTGLTTVLAVAVGLGVGEVLLVLGAVLSGQLAIGWANDALDAQRDRASGRTDKPVATGGVGRGTVARAAVVAAVVCVPLSLALGTRPGLLHLAVLVSGLAYDLGLKATAASWVPYAVAFGALPAVVVTTAGADPPVWLVLAGALLGVGAHVFNVLPDLEDDRATGVRGMPVLLGRTAARWTGALLLFLAAASLVLGPAGDPSATGVVVLVVSAALAVTGAVAGRDPSSRLPFLLALVAAAVDVALLADQSAALL